MKKSVRKKDTENLSESNIKKVIGLLEGSPSITKKEACEVLNISYNTTRLNRIIEEYKEKQENNQRIKNKKKGTPAQKDEIKYIITEYLNGESISEISKSCYRSSVFVKSIIEKIGVPERAKGEDRYKVGFLPDNCMSEDFEVGEIAWSAKYHAACKIIKKLQDSYYIPKYSTSCYDIWVYEKSDDPFLKGGFFASQLGYDLGKLSHLKEYGVNLNDI